MRYSGLFLLALLISLVFCGCSLTHPKQEVQYYVLALPPPSPVPSGPAPVKASLVVRPFTAQPPYDRDRMVYRSSPYEFDFYHYHRWVTKPADILTALTRRTLQQAGLFTAVYPTPDARADLRLGGVVRQYEEVDQAQSWQAALSIEVWLSRSQESAPFWFQSYSATRRASRRNPVAVAEAMSQNLQDILDRLTNDLAGALASQIPDAKDTRSDNTPLAGAGPRPAPAMWKGAYSPLTENAIRALPDIPPQKP